MGQYIFLLLMLYKQANGRNLFFQANDCEDL